MKKILYMLTACLMVSACGNFNDKQPVDATYYKKTQSVAWPTEQKAAVKKAPAKVQAKTQTGTTVTKTVSTTTTTSETTTYTK